MVQRDINREVNLSIISEKIDLLKTEVQESKLYLELAFIALLILVFGYFKSDVGQASVQKMTIFGKMIIGITVGLYIGIVYFFYTIIKFNSKYRRLIKEKIDKLIQSEN